MKSRSLPFGRLMPVILLTMILSFTGFSGAFGQTVTTDKPDYAPGETVVITGAGWETGQTVNLMIEHLVFNHDTEYLTPIAVESDGTFTSTEYVIDPSDLGESFRLTATGSVSGSAVAYFTDGPAGDGDGYFFLQNSVTGFRCGGGTSLTFEFEFNGGEGNSWGIGSSVQIDVPWSISVANVSTTEISNVDVNEATISVSDIGSIFGGGSIVTIEFSGLSNQPRFHVVFSGAGVDLPPVSHYKLPVLTNNSSVAGDASPIGVFPEIGSSTERSGILLGAVSSCESVISGSVDFIGTGAVVRWETRNFVQFTPTGIEWGPWIDQGRSGQNSFNLNSAVLPDIVQFRVITTGSGCGVALSPNPDGLTEGPYYESEYAMVAKVSEPYILMNDVLIEAFTLDPIDFGHGENLYVFSITPPDVHYYIDYVDELNPGTEITSPHAFPPGSTTVTVTAANQCYPDPIIETFEVITGIIPEIACPDAVSAFTDPGVCEATVTIPLTWDGQTATPPSLPGHYIGWPEPTIEYSLNDTDTWLALPGDDVFTFPKDLTTVHVKATNIVGSHECSFTVTVVDNEPPSLTGDPYTGTTGTNACMDEAFDEAPFSPEDAIQGYTDNCGQPVTAEMTDYDVTGSDCDWTITYTFKVIDDSNNELLDQTYSNSGSDQDPATLDGPMPVGQDNVNACMDEVEIDIYWPRDDDELALEGAYVDDCSPEVWATFVSEEFTPESGQCDWVLVRTYKIHDGCVENDFTVTMTYTGGDRDPAFLPEGVSQPEGVDNVNACMDEVEIDTYWPRDDDEIALEGAYVDDCSPEVWATFVSEAFTPESGQCDWVLVRTYKIHDGCVENDFTVTMTYTGGDRDPAFLPEGVSQPEGVDNVNACMDEVEIDTYWPRDDDELALEGAYVDDCSPEVWATFVSEAFTPESGQCDWVLVRTYKIHDGCVENDFTVTMTYTGSDQDPAFLPDGVSQPDGVSDINACMDAIEIGGTYPTADDEIALEGAYVDDCSPEVWATFVSEAFTPESGQCDWVLVRTYKIHDGCVENDFNVTMTYKGSDQDPAFLPEGLPQPDGVSDINACMDAIEISGTYQTADDELALEDAYVDDCSPTVEATFVSEEFTLESNQCNWVLERTYNISDGCVTNDFTVIMTYSGGDRDPATLEGEMPVGVSGINSCADEASVDLEYPVSDDEDALEAVYSDDCGVVTATIFSQDFTGDNCEWSLVRTFTISDGCVENDFTVTMTYSGGDDTAPNLIDELIGCSTLDMTDVDECLSEALSWEGASITADVELLYEDNCGGIVTAVFVDRVAGADNDDCDWTFTYNYDISDECDNVTSCSVVRSGGDHSAPILTGAYCDVAEPVQRDTEPGECVYIPSEGEFDVDIDDCNLSVTVYLSIEDIYLGEARTRDFTFLPGEPATLDGIEIIPGPSTITWTAMDDCDNLSEPCTFDVFVEIATETSVYVSSESAIYGDEVTLYAEIITNCEGYPLAGEVEFKIDGTSVGTAQAIVIPPNEPGAGTTLRAELYHQVLEMPWWTDDPNEVDAHNVEAFFTPDPVVSPLYLPSDDETPFWIYPQKASPYDATVGFYTGQILAWTTTAQSATGTVTMAATLVDGSIPSGDITAAKVTFVYINGDGDYTPIPSAKDLPVGLIEMTEGTVGFASADVQLDIQKKTQTASFDIGVMITGAYYNNVVNTATVVTVSRAVEGGSIMGSGRIENINSSGLIRGLGGRSTTFSYDVQYNKKATNPQGKMTIWVISRYTPDGYLDTEEHTYVIKSNAINMFIVGPQQTAEGEVLAANQAIFDAKANLSELVGGVLVDVEGNSPLHVTMTDGGYTTGDGTFTPDEIGITYYNSNGGIWYSSNWSWEVDPEDPNQTPVGTIEQPILAGDIVVESTAKTDGETDRGKPDKDGVIVNGEIVDGTALAIYPNPTNGPVTFEFILQNDGNTTIDIYSANGQLVQRAWDGFVKGGEVQSVHVDRKLARGMYFIQLRSGNEMITSRLIVGNRFVRN